MTFGPAPNNSPRAVGPPRPVRPSGVRAIAPEAMATVIAAIVVASVVGGVLATGPSTGVPGSSGRPAQSALPTPEPTPAIDRAAITACLTINQRLAAGKEALDAELATDQFEAGNVGAILRSMNADVIAAETAAQRLAQMELSATVGERLVAFYSDLHDRISAVLDNSVRNAAAYRAGATAISAKLEGLGDLNILLRRLREQARSTPSPAPSSPPPSVAPTPSTPPVTPPPTPSPASIPPSEPPTGSAQPSQVITPGEVVNPGFESGVGSPWELVLAPLASATLTPDKAVHNGGAGSARVDITDAGAERAAVAVRQGGLPVETGSRYVAAISVRAASPREVRLRIASATGDTYGTRLFTVGPEWQVLTVDATVFATDPNAYLEVDLGRFPVTTWLDDASFGRVVATGG